MGIVGNFCHQIARLVRLMAIGAVQDLSDAICISIGEDTGNGKNSLWFEVGLMIEPNRTRIRGWAANGLMDTHFGMRFRIKPGDGLRHLRWGVVCPVKVLVALEAFGIGHPFQIPFPLVFLVATCAARLELFGHMVDARVVTFETGGVTYRGKIAVCQDQPCRWSERFGVTLGTVVVKRAMGMT